MVNRKYILGFFLMSLVLLVGSVSAASNAQVAYIYKSKTDRNIIALFSDLGISVDMIKESSFPMDLSGYKMIFVGDENFAETIPIKDYPSVIMNHYIAKDIGLVGSVGISQLTSNQPLLVNYNGNQIAVYSDSKDSRGASLSYYFLDNENKAVSLSQFLGTYSTSSGADFGSVSAFGSPGDVLENGDVLKQNICFFGITKTDYWTPEAEGFFKECLKYVFDYTYIPPEVIVCSKDSECGTNSFTGLAFCSGNDVFKNFISNKCNNPGKNTSYCSSQTTGQLFEKCSAGCSAGKCNAVTCTKDIDCSDGNSTTEDICVNKGTAESVCVHNIYNNVTQIKLVSFVATPSITSVTLNFSAFSDNNSVVKGYLLSKDKENWNLVLSPATGYVFDGLTEATNYVFYAKAVDVNNINSEMMSISVTTLSTSNGGDGDGSGGSGGGSGGGGGSSGGGFSYCTTSWQCGDWSECSGGKQTRSCSIPAGMCTPEKEKPSESQSCLERASPSFENSAENSNLNNSEGTTKGSNPITGAAITGALGKYSWIGVIVVALGGLVAYYFVRKFAAAKAAA